MAAAAAGAWSPTRSAELRGLGATAAGCAPCANPVAEEGRGKGGGGAPGL